MLEASKELMSHAHDAMLNEIDVRDIVKNELDKIPEASDLLNGTSEQSLVYKIRKLKNFIISPDPQMK